RPCPVVGAELLEDLGQLGAGRQRHPVQLPGNVQRDRRHAATGIALHPEPVVAHPADASSRSMRRRIFPDGLLGRASTKRYSRGRLNRASVSDARQKRSRSSAATYPSATTTATIRWPSRSSAAPITATSRTA